MSVQFVVLSKSCTLKLTQVLEFLSQSFTWVHCSC